ncbi:hypothetical protein FRX31_029657 [Thalictrum thalictroides]|uniref:Uncharacterized protein n=1 Tax=Thalictrum thalictroides TaxID=46969 RepID=A0A7J6V843_THATH|nr:hypothetical protein FRX31_029657 [Thalictrum thalictroides]
MSLDLRLFAQGIQDQVGNEASLDVVDVFNEEIIMLLYVLHSFSSTNSLSYMESRSCISMHNRLIDHHVHWAFLLDKKLWMCLRIIRATCQEKRCNKLHLSIAKSCSNKKKGSCKKR